MVHKKDHINTFLDPIKLIDGQYIVEQEGRRYFVLKRFSDIYGIKSTKASSYFSKWYAKGKRKAWLTRPGSDHLTSYNIYDDEQVSVVDFLENCLAADRYYFEDEESYTRAIEYVCGASDRSPIKPKEAEFQASGDPADSFSVQSAISRAREIVELSDQLERSKEALNKTHAEAVSLSQSIARTKAKIRQLVTPAPDTDTPPMYTAWSYLADVLQVKQSREFSAQLGRKASFFSREIGLQIGKESHSTYGTINRYQLPALKKAYASLTGSAEE